MAILKTDTTVNANNLILDSSSDLDISTIGGSSNANIRMLSADTEGNLLFTDVSPLAIYNFYVKGIGGDAFGYTSGGTGPTLTTTIDKFPFNSDANATDVGEISGTYTNRLTGQSSSTNGYTSGGQNAVNYTNLSHINKFPFSSDSPGSNIGDLTQARYGAAGQHSSTYGYTSGGVTSPFPFIAQDIIDKFPFSSDTNATDVGDLTQTRGSSAGQSSGTHGYTSGGATAPYSNVIDKFPFTSDTNATDVGDLTQVRSGQTGQSSLTHGYSSGGQTSGWVNTIEKFPFTSDTNATDVGDLTNTTRNVAGQSSITHGYTSGGTAPSPSSVLDTIDKFPFSSDTNATDIGNLTQAREEAAGQQI